MLMANLRSRNSIPEASVVDGLCMVRSFLGGLSWLAAILACVILLSGGSARASDYWVDGKAGSDVSGDGSRAKPWRTIEHALARVPTPVYPQSHRIRIAGGQSYSPPRTLTMKFNVRLVGDAASVPTIRAWSASAPIVRFARATIYNRKESGVESIAFEGGAYALALGGVAGNRHRPEIERCSFRGQTLASIRIDLRGGTISDPRIARCSFTGVPLGIDTFSSGRDNVLRMDVEEGRFLDVRTDAVRISDTSGGTSDVGGRIRFCWFQRCGRGVAVTSGGGAAQTRVEIRHCAFDACATTAIACGIGLAGSTKIGVDHCSFVRGGAGFRFGGVFGLGRHSVRVASCVAIANRGTAFEIDMRQSLAGLVRANVAMRSNVARANRRGFDLDGGVADVVFDSHGDRALGSAEFGMRLRGGAKVEPHVESDIFAANGGDGLILATGAPGVVRFLTLADNGAVGLGVDAKVPGATRVDHLVFASNKSGAIRAPSTFAIRWSLFDKTLRPGRGNLVGNARLLRPQYKLRSTSPARDAGDPKLVSTGVDYEGDPRVVGRAADLGADEFVPAGSAHLYGFAGFAAAGFRPRLELPPAQHGVGLGKTMRIRLADARDLAASPATLALLLVGATEVAPGPLTSLAALGAPGSLLQLDLRGGFFAFAVPSTGKVETRFTIPKQSALLDATFTTQWLVIKPAVNAAGFVTTEGLRVTIGR